MSDVGKRKAIVDQALGVLTATPVAGVESQAKRCASIAALFSRVGMRTPALGIRLAKCVKDDPERYAINTKAFPANLTLEVMLAMRNLRSAEESMDAAGAIVEVVTDRLSGLVCTTEPLGFFMWSDEEYVYDEKDKDLFAVLIRFDVPVILGT